MAKPYSEHLKASHDLETPYEASGTAYRWRGRKPKVWSGKPNDDTDIELNLRGLAWGEGERTRTLIYNLTVPLFGNNVDLCLFRCGSEAMCKEVHADPGAYVALGELKGGIDPAGADEHWKTARTALHRIREAFAEHKLTPHTFFIGASIETKMASEIWRMLDAGELENAANLTDDEQIASLTRWLCSL
jgi:type II restriction enzyme